MHHASTQDAVLVEIFREHVQVAEAHALVGGVGQDMKRNVAGRAQHDAVARGDHVVLVGLAAVGALDALGAEARPDVLTLVAEAGRTFANVEIAMFAEIIAPGIGVVDGLIRDQKLAIDPAAIERRLAERSERYASGLVAVAPMQERLRIGKGRGLGQREVDPGIDRIVGAARVPPHAGAGQEVARAVVGKYGRERLWAINSVRDDRPGLRLRRAARHLE